jgi:hypothetical protein
MLFAAFTMLISSFSGIAQKQKFNKVSFLNISLLGPVGNCDASSQKCDVSSQDKDLLWAVEKILLFDDTLFTNTIGHGVALKAPSGVKYVKIMCYHQNEDVESFITDLASKQSIEPTFAYMSIEAVKDAKIADNNAKLLTYGNSFLNESFVGGYYGFIKGGYIYTIEYYSEDNPKDIKFIDRILKTIRISDYIIQPTIVEQAEFFAPKEAKSQAEIDAQAAQEAEKAAQSKVKTSFIKKIFKR